MRVNNPERSCWAMVKLIPNNTTAMAEIVVGILKFNFRMSIFTILKTSKSTKKSTSANAKKSVGLIIPRILFPKLLEAEPAPLISVVVKKSENSR